MDSRGTPLDRVKVAAITPALFMQCILAWTKEERSSPRLVAYLNAHNVNLAFQDEEYASILSRADLVYADGMAVVWGWRWLGTAVPERVNAADLIGEFCGRAADAGISLFLLGGREGVAGRAAQRWQQVEPRLRLAGTGCGYWKEGEEEALAEGIRKASPDILLVGLGAPLQEKWAARWGERLGTPVVWCVGALFEYDGENRSRAPAWMRRAGLEWTWRLALEPRRLWRRYLMGNLIFLRNLWRLRQAMKRH